MKYNVEEINIGDIIKTKDGAEGPVVALFSYSYLNDKYQRELYLQQYPQDESKILIDMTPFGMDNVKHKGYKYSSAIIAISEHNKTKQVYYLSSVDLREIKEIIKPNQEKKISFFDRLKAFFTLLYHKMKSLKFLKH